MTSVNGILQDFFISPLANIGIAGYVFKAKQVYSLDAGADLTQNLVQSGSFKNDNMNIKPVVIKVSGIVSELSFTEKKVVNAISTVTQAGGVLSSYITRYSTASQQASAKIQNQQVLQSSKEEYLNIVNNGVDIFTTIESLLPPLNDQGRAWFFFNLLKDLRLDVGITVPKNRFFLNMRVINVSEVVGTKSFQQSDFNITLQQFKEYQVATTTYDPALFSDSLVGNLAQPVKKIGSVQGTKDKKMTSLLVDIKNGSLSAVNNTSLANLVGWQ